MALPTPNLLTSTLALNCSNPSLITPTLNLDPILEKPLVDGGASVLMSRENQHPVPVIVIDTATVADKSLAVACEGNTTPDSDSSFSSTPLTTISANSSPSMYYVCSSSPQTIQENSNTRAATYYYLPSNTKDQRRASIEKLRLGPLTEESVSILVESNGIVRSFLVHIELLCHFSPFFRSIFAKREPKVFTKEVQSLSYANELDFDRSADEKVNEEGKVEVNIKVNIPPTRAHHSFRLPSALGDVKHPEFAAFIDWLYLGTSKLEQIDDPMANQLLIRLWVFAGRLGVPSCQNDCIAAIENNRKRSRTISTSMIGWVYRNTKDYAKNQCGLRNMLIDQCALALDEKSLLEEMQEPGFTEHFPMECLFDIIARMRILLRESGLGAGSLAIDPRSRRYRNDAGEGNIA
ncbi:hypothetical protein N431DRAFT_337944 [Stipitochalara longipes BDJ]|nr:hypothetical protein N431DRAFT_337944 [Stipitochalara longipes BDJ]